MHNDSCVASKRVFRSVILCEHIDSSLKYKGLIVYKNDY